MLGSWSKEAGAQLYCIEPSGTGYGKDLIDGKYSRMPNPRLLGLRRWQGQVRGQDGVGEDQDDRDDLRGAHQGSCQDHLPGVGKIIALIDKDICSDKYIEIMISRCTMR